MEHVEKIEYIGEMPPRKDLEVIPLTKEEIEKQISDYLNFKNQYDNDLEFKARIDAECEQWEKEFQEYKDAELKRRKECWARGEYTLLLELGVGFLKPYPRLRNPEEDMFAGWKNAGCVISGFDKGEIK